MAAMRLVIAAIVAVLPVVLEVPVLAVVGGLALALALPGLALAPRRVAGVERAVLVPTLSLAVVVLGGLALNAAGIRLGGPAWALVTGGVTAVAVGARKALARWADRAPADRRRWAEERSPGEGGRPWTERYTKRTIALAVLCLALLCGAVAVSLISAATTGGGGR
jgi:uncharacterized membrane protein